MNIKSKFCVLILFISVINLGFCFAQTPLNSGSIEMDLLNEHLLKEVNKLRKKAKVPLLKNEKALSLASEDHVNYMAKKQKLTHYQNDKTKKTPKNRVDFFGQQFDLVGENVQLNNLNLHSSPKNKLRPRIDTYEVFAEQLVLAWKNSAPHYDNMINNKFVTTYTSVSIGVHGEVYACQLFGGAKYHDVYKDFRDSVDFKPYNPKKCRHCKSRIPGGLIRVHQDGAIYYEYVHPKFFFGILPKPVFKNTKMRFFRPRKDGLAADIIVLSQYPCDSNSYFNGLSNFRGIPLKPVYKKDFNGGIHFRYTRIYLGHIPSYIQEPVEVNLVVIRNNRPCLNTMYHQIPVGFDLDIPLSYGFDPTLKTWKNVVLDTIESKIFFEKSQIVPSDSNLNYVLNQIYRQTEQILSAEIQAFASIEGSNSGNSQLYQQRAEFLRRGLISIALDSARIKSITAENFQDFRKDVVGTKFEYLLAFNDSLLKEKILNSDLSEELEFLLKKHRYAKFRIILRREIEMEYDAKTVNEHLKEAIEKGQSELAFQLQQVQYALLLSGKMSPKEIELVQIPILKKHIKLLHNFAVMKYGHLPTSVESLKAFQADLESLKIFRKNDKSINTSLAIIDYHLYKQGNYDYKKLTFYDSIKKWTFLDEVQRARILLNVAAQEDWKRWNTTKSLNERDYYYGRAKSLIPNARLDVDKTFEIASYYSFFKKERFAYELIKSKIDETENPENLIFFLKLVHILEQKLPRTTYLGYFKKIKIYSGDRFCSFFNSPALNFQLLDDDDIKAIYCKACGNDD